MRVANWKAEPVFNEIKQRALGNASEFMDEVFNSARSRCPIGTITRTGGFRPAKVSFIPKRGKDKGKLIEFGTQSRWSSRKPGDLIRTIRRVDRHRPSGSNLRVYAGNYKIYWAFMVEFGTSSTGWGGPAKKQPFMRPAWNAKKRDVKNKIKNG